MASVPFQVAQDAGNRFAKIATEREDKNVIEEILTKARYAKRKDQIEELLGQVISRVSPARQSAAVNLLGGKYDEISAQEQLARKKGETEAERARIAADYKALGYDPALASLPPAVQTQQIKDQAKDARYKADIGGNGQAQSGLPIQPNIADTSVNQAVQPPFLPGQGSKQAPLPKNPNKAWFENKSRQELMLLVGHDDKRISEPAKEQIKLLDKIEEDQANIGKEYHKLREKNVSEYVNKVFAEGELASEERFALETARRAAQGDITGPGTMAYLKSNPYTGFIVGLTPDEAELVTSNKKLLEGSKGLFGAKPTEKEIFILLEQFLPSISKTMEANLIGINFIEKLNNIKIARAEITDKLTEGGTKYVANLEREVDKAMQPLADAYLKELRDAEPRIAQEKEKGMSDSDKLLQKTRQRKAGIK